MNRILLTSLLIILFSSMFAQNIEDFLNLRASNFDAVKEELTCNNWYLYDEDEQRKNDIYVYTFKHIDDVQSMVSIQWIDYVHRPRHYNKNRLSFQIQNKALYEQYISEIIMLGFVFDQTKEIYDNNIFVYTNGDVSIEVITSQSKYMYDGSVYYNFAFYNKLEYDAVFEKEKEANQKKIAPLTNITKLHNFD